MKWVAGGTMLAILGLGLVTLPKVTTETDHQHTRERRMIFSEAGATHPFATNMWWQHAKLTASNLNMTNCYVCTHLPTSTVSTLYAYNLTREKTSCLVALSTHPGNNKTLSQANYNLPFNLTTRERTPLRGEKCDMLTDVTGFPQLGVPLSNHVVLVSTLFAYCAKGNGTVKVGETPKGRCNQTYSFCPYNNENKCLLCLTNSACRSISKDRSSACALDVSHRIEGSNCSPIFPGPKGSRVLADWYWVCGHNAYASLPANWGGLCALAALTDHTIVMKEVSHHPHHRTKRDTQTKNGDFPSPTFWGMTTDTGVPYEFRIWGGGAKFAQSLFPWIGVAEVRAHVEINRYGLLRLINATTKLGTATQSEFGNIRDIFVQHRMVLDLLTASQGGVCAIVGKTCCTFVTNHTDGQGIQEALDDLHDLQKYVADHTPGARPAPWTSWFSIGAWWQILLKIAMPFIIMLVVIFIILCCVIPCVQAMVQRMIGNSLSHYNQVMYAQLQQRDQDDYAV